MKRLYKKKIKMDWEKANYYKTFFVVILMCSIFGSIIEYFDRQNGVHFSTTALMVPLGAVVLAIMIYFTNREIYYEEIHSSAKR